MDATAAVDQTLTCNIGGVKSQAVDVSWKNSGGCNVKDGVGGYTVTKGTVDENKNQKSTLTIAASTLSNIDDRSKPRTWKCAAKSTLYPDSALSTYSDVVVTFHEYSKLHDFHISK